MPAGLQNGRNLGGGATMRDYRAYILGTDGDCRFTRVADFSSDLPDDAAAIKAAEKLDDGHDVELWDCKRLVAKIDHNSHSVTLGDDPLMAALRKVPNESLAPSIEILAAPKAVAAVEVQTAPVE